MFYGIATAGCGPVLAGVGVDTEHDAQSHVLCHCRPQVCILADSSVLGRKARVSGFMVIKLEAGWPNCSNAPACLAGPSRIVDLHDVRASHHQHTDCWCLSNILLW